MIRYDIKITEFSEIKVAFGSLVMSSQYFVDFKIHFVEFLTIVSIGRLIGLLLGDLGVVDLRFFLESCNRCHGDRRENADLRIRVKASIDVTVNRWKCLATRRPDQLVVALGQRLWKPCDRVICAQSLGI